LTVSSWHGLMVGPELHALARLHAIRGCSVGGAVMPKRQPETRKTIDPVTYVREIEAKWLSSDDVYDLIDCLKDGGHADTRRLRLYACALARFFWDGFGHPVHRRVVELAEAFADGLIPFGELDSAFTLARELPERFQTEEDGADICPGRVAFATAFEDAAFGAWEAYYNGAAVCGFLADVPGADRFDGVGPLRDVFGNPFRLVTFDPRWRTSDVVGLARAIYDDGAFERMPILADALMDAGCEDEHIIGHCRGDRTHVRGCWVVDLVLGKITKRIGTTDTGREIG